ncbi:DNA-3-methyladenine glycosylase 2, partial [Salmonella enterica]|nr:DNA-3-methyladenine glycosylase 2 [Salmonella enterica]
MFTLSWQPPYDWSWMLGFLAARAVDGVETVGEGFYARSLVVGEHRGLISVSPHLPTHTVQVSVSAGLLPVAPACLAKVSRLFDLDCQPAQVAAV